MDIDSPSAILARRLMEEKESIEAEMVSEPTSREHMNDADE